MKPLIEIAFDATESEAESLLDIIVQANEDAGIPSQEGDELMIRLKHPDTGALIGGLYAERYYRWLFVRYLAVPRSMRGEGIGTHLLGMAEARAKETDCIGIWLDTFSFQAAPFYRKHGYRQFGEIADYPPGHQRVFFQKRFDAGANRPDVETSISRP